MKFSTSPFLYKLNFDNNPKDIKIFNWVNFYD